MQLYDGMHDVRTAGNHGFVLCPMRICIQWWLWEECVPFGENFGLLKGGRACHSHAYCSFITHLIRSIHLFETLFRNVTVWIVELWIHAQLQCQQIFKLRRSTGDEIGADSVTELHCIKFWPGRCTFEGAVWYSRSHHWEDPTNFCIEELGLLRVWMVPCPDELSVKCLWIGQLTKTF